MATINYSTVDVFTSEKFAGNQLAIVQVPPSGLTQEQKLMITKEFNYSETTFVHIPKDGAQNEWTVDIFTLDQELPFAGHPTIGTACHLLAPLANSSANTVKGTFNLKAGRVDLEYDATSGYARAAIPHNVHLHKAVFSGAEIAKLQPKLGRIPERSPVFSIVTGMTFVLAELDSLDSMTFVNPTSIPITVPLDDSKEESFIGCYFYYQMSEEQGVTRLRTRMIAADVGEDPATGSAASALACYLTLREQRKGTTWKYMLQQGYEMGRPSNITVEVKTTPEGKIDTVLLSGSAVQVMEGKLTL